ncbi:hypothetical protein OS188_06455 [Xanthomarina sp. F1114]|uniref:hypothetical protein n=1 Tax=Xanthomarina sp. F1114 TaxID=2996019 RepID=UPI00225DD6B0|nr:hypothetical protein [Xanthomarina sp. F1114]MCX7547592.1 hypothetical protein [Xanthomarina sp. F1114]
MKHTLFFLSIFLFVFSCSKDSTDDSNDSITCHFPINISVGTITTNSAIINWIGNNSNSYEIEYGISGFTRGQGTTISTSGLGYEFTDLSQATSYDVYLTTKCSDTNFSDVIGPVVFVTETACQKPTSLNLDTIDLCSISLYWDSNGESDFKVEYGVTGFNLGTGRVINTTDNFTTIDTYLQAGTTYDIYVRANCGSDGFSAYSDPLVVTTVSQDLTGSYHVIVTRDNGIVTDQGIETITLISPNYYKTQTTGHWPIGYYNTDQGFNFENSCGEIIIPDQQLFQGASTDTVYSLYGYVMANGDFVVEYEIDTYDYLVYSAYYEKQ